MNSLFKGVDARFDFSMQTPKDFFSSDRKSSAAQAQIRRTGINIKEFFAAAILSLLLVSPAYASVVGANHTSPAVSAGISGANSTSHISMTSQNLVAAKTVGDRMRPNSIRSLELDELESTAVFMPAVAGARASMNELQASTLAILDENERIRLSAFARLSQGWDFGSGEPLNARSLQNFDRFFSRGNFAPAELSLFMSTDGNVVASWPDGSGGTVEIEFKPDHFSYFDDSMDEPQSVNLLSAAELRRRIAEELVGS